MFRLFGRQFFLPRHSHAASLVPASRSIVVHYGYRKLYRQTGFRGVLQPRPLQRHPVSFAAPAAPNLLAKVPDRPGKTLVATVDGEHLAGQGFFRLDVFLSRQLQSKSRAKAASYIQRGFVEVDGQRQTKTSHRVRQGQLITCLVPPPEPIGVLPEDISLDVTFEDEHLLVVNKPAGMVTHPGPGHMESGTLVNALLHRWQLPAIVVDQPTEQSADLDGLSEDEAGSEASLAGHFQTMQSLRPGIVHRLDKGTTGLLVVAKHDAALAHLSDQFKQRTVHRRYISILVGCPPTDGMVITNIGRHMKDRKLMAPYTQGSARSRLAKSTFQLLGVLAGQGAALASWHLGTGRTHQIRVHAKHIGHPIFGDEAYGGTGKAVASRVAGASPVRQAVVQAQMTNLGRPALHAMELGFQHPITGQWLQFSAEKPHDFAAAEQALASL